MLYWLVMVSPRSAHLITFFVGSVFLTLSVYLAFFVKGSYFYTSFALGSWLIFDYIDYKLNNISILDYFYSHKYRDIFCLFFIVSFIFCFIIDYIWGVQVLKIWKWNNYTLIEYLRMYLVMNVSFVLGMYEFYRIVNTILKPIIRPDYLINFTVPENIKALIYKIMFWLGIFFLFLPLITLFMDEFYQVREFIMIFPFISMTLISDPLIYLLGGQVVLEELLRFNKIKTASLIITVIIAFTFTEGLNLLGGEWKYIRMPFYNIQLFSVPVAVLIGWLPLVIGAISIVNLITHLGFMYRKRQIEVVSK